MLSNFSFSEDTIGFLIEGKFDEKAITSLSDQINLRLQLFDRINLYLEDSNIESFSLSAVIQEIMFKIENSNRFRKMALVTDRKWIHLCASIEGIFMDADVKSFSTMDRLEALAWIAHND